METYIKYVKEILKKLVDTPSPTGDTEKVSQIIEEELDKLGVDHNRTHKGAVLAKIPGKSKEGICYAGHIDTLGAMVREIRADGNLSFTKIGGFPYSSVERENVQVKNKKGEVFQGTIVFDKSSVHAHGEEFATDKRTQDNVYIRLDELVDGKMIESKEDIEKLGIGIGDFISIDPKLVFTDSGFIKSRHLDDKACVAVILGQIKFLKEKEIELSNDSYFFFSNYEEVGHGASYLDENIKDLIAVDMAVVDPGQASREDLVTICAMDSSGPYDLEIRNTLVELAENSKLDYVIDIYPGYGSDGSAALRAGNEIRVGLIGPGVASSHSYERTHEKALENTLKLLIEYSIR